MDAKVGNLINSPSQIEILPLEDCDQFTVRVMSNLFCHRRRLVGSYQCNMLSKRNAHHQQGTLLKTRNGLQQTWEHANSNIPGGRQTWLCTFSGTPQPQAQFLEAPIYMASGYTSLHCKCYFTFLNESLLCWFLMQQ